MLHIGGEAFFCGGFCSVARYCHCDCGGDNEEKSLTEKNAWVGMCRRTEKLSRNIDGKRSYEAAERKGKCLRCAP